MTGWLVLILAGLMEAVWATALGRIDSPNAIQPILIWLGGMAASMAGLGYALRTIEVGTAYAVWTGIGVISTVAYAVIFTGAPFSWLKGLCLVMIVAGVVGLRLLGS